MASVFEDESFAFAPTVAAQKRCAIIYNKEREERLVLPSQAAYSEKLTMSPVEVADYALCKNSELRELVIPENTEKLGAHVLLQSNNLESISCLSSTPLCATKRPWMMWTKLP